MSNCRAGKIREKDPGHPRKEDPGHPRTEGRSGRKIWDTQEEKDPGHPRKIWDTQEISSRWKEEWRKRNGQPFTD
jgi:hypothetical protein